MNERLPPLTALRAFEAAARHMSFAKAADELHVTPAVLSYQIKSLETELGQPLFRRLNRAVELTAAGKALSPGTTEAFERLRAAWRQTRRLQDSGVLTVTAGPAFTSKWLAPRMYEFAQKHPEIDLRFVASLRLVDFDRDEVDLAIRFGTEVEDGLFAEPLIAEWLTPIMPPALAETLTGPQDLPRVPLIHDDSLINFATPTDWDTWCAAAGVSLDTSHGPRFSQADHSLDAAMSGAGVVLGRITLATRALESGRLVAPFDVGIVADAQFRFVCPAGAETKPKIAAFRAWVMQEIGASRHFEAGRRLVRASDLAGKAR